MYDTPIAEGDDYYSVKLFIDACQKGSFTDYDGFGNPAQKNGMVDTKIYIKPSRLHEIPEDADYIVWYNR